MPLSLESKKNIKKCPEYDVCSIASHLLLRKNLADNQVVCAGTLQSQLIHSTNFYLTGITCEVLNAFFIKIVVAAKGVVKLIKSYLYTWFDQILSRATKGKKQSPTERK